MQDIHKSVWGGTVSFVVTLSPDDLTDFVIPRPLHLTVPRLILWSSFITVVHSYFVKQTAQLDQTVYPYDNKFLFSTSPILEACANELDLAEIRSPLWLEGPGKTVIDWRTPVGVCVDLWTSSGAINCATFPIKIVAHFSKRPEGLADCNVVVCRGWSQQHKQSVKNGNRNVSNSSLNSSSSNVSVNNDDNNLDNTNPQSSLLSSSTSSVTGPTTSTSTTAQTTTTTTPATPATTTTTTTTLLSPTSATTATTPLFSSASTTTTAVNSTTTINKSKDPDTIAKQAINTTKRALIEHNTRSLLPIFLQLPSSTHIHSALSRLKISSTILHNKPTFIMNLPTSTQSQFVSSLFSNSCAELHPVVPMCDCSQCTTFLTTLAGYDLNTGSLSVPLKAAKAVKIQVKKVISALKRDHSSDSDNDDDNDDNNNHNNHTALNTPINIINDTENNNLNTSTSNTNVNNVTTNNNTNTTTPAAATTAMTTPATTVTNHSNEDSTANIVSPNKNKSMVLRHDMTKDEREQYAILTTPAQMLFCQVTRLIILSRSLCGTLSSHEKALTKLNNEAQDAWRRRAGRLEAEQLTPNSNQPEVFAAKDFLDGDDNNNNNNNNNNGNNLDDNNSHSNALLQGWKPYYHDIPMNLYFTQHLAMYCASKIGQQSEINTNSLQLNWSKYRLVSSFNQTLPTTGTPSSPTASNTPSTTTPATTTTTPIAATQPHQYNSHNWTIEQFMQKIAPHWKYRYGKPPAPKTKKYILFNDHNNNDENIPTLESDNDDDNDEGDDGDDDDDDDDTNPYIVVICQGVILPYDTPLIWLYNHMAYPDLKLHLTIALEQDLESKLLQ